MVVIFIHQNFPSQYVHLVRHLADIPHNRVFFITQSEPIQLPRVIKVIYKPDTVQNPNCHPYTERFDAAVRTGLAVADVCRRLRSGGVVPDIPRLLPRWTDLLAALTAGRRPSPQPPNEGLGVQTHLR
jgi:hypothetical protein